MNNKEKIDLYADAFQEFQRIFIKEIPKGIAWSLVNPIFKGLETLMNFITNDFK